MSQKIIELPVGAKVKFGAYSVEGEGSHAIKWIKMNEGDTTFLSEFIEDLRPFDAKERENNNGYRRDYGNNRYSVSNIDQFLNSCEDKWFSKRHEYDTPPTNDNIYDRTEYENHPGFLCYFKDWEINAILDTDIKVAIPKCDDDEVKSEVITRQIFLPSLTNIFGSTVRGIREDKQWDYFKDNRHSRCAKTTEAIYDNANYDGVDRFGDWYWWLRSPNADNSYDVRCVDLGGGCGYCDAYDGRLGVRPALRINPEILVSDSPDDEGYYEVLQSKVETIEISEEDFFGILNN